MTLEGEMYKQSRAQDGVSIFLGATLRLRSTSSPHHMTSNLLRPGIGVFQLEHDVQLS